jgi:hypothetical protein
VSAQNYYSGASGAAESVIVEATTVTDANGAFRLFPKPMSYMLVAQADGFS